MGDQDRTEYLRGFVHGMHFVLLALQGRLTARQLTPEETREVFAEYYRLVEEYRDHFAEPAATQVALRFEDEPPVA